MTNVVAHPKLTAGFAKVLTRRMEAERAKGIAELQGAIEDLTRVAGEPRYDFARGLIREYQQVRDDLETVDLANPHSAERVSALGERLEKLQEDLRHRVVGAQ